MLLIREQLKKKMKEDFWSFEMRCYRNLLNIRWHQKVTNDSIRQQLNKQKTIINTIRHKKLTLFGHICRMPHNRLLKSVLFGCMEALEGVWCWGRQPKRWLDNITEWTGVSIDAVKMTQDRDVGRRFVFGLNGPWPWDMKMMIMPNNGIRWSSTAIWRITMKISFADNAI